MKILKYPAPGETEPFLVRPGDAQAAGRREKAAAILAAVRAGGDEAVLHFSRQFDGLAGQPLRVSATEMADAEKALSPALQAAIRQAYANIRAFHETQREKPRRVETTPGVVCWRKNVAIEKVGLYIPGGTAPLFSTVLMLGVPAQLAGCRETVLCTPARPDGSVHPAILFAARLCGIDRVFRIGGVQAIGAMAYGTETVPRVWKIFGPGNPWVTAAKQLVSLDGTAIDLPAGPSEVCVVADDTADPCFVAADLLSQAEHGTDSQVLLLSTSDDLVQKVLQELEVQLAVLPRRELAQASLQNSTAIVVNTLDEALSVANDYAPEHLILQVAEPEAWADRVVNAGSVFLGAHTPESAGDYASGTNHTLPTGGWARAFGGVSLDSFVKKITFQQIAPHGLHNLGPVISEMARAEGLEAHARAVEVRGSGGNYTRKVAVC